MSHKCYYQKEYKRKQIKKHLGKRNGRYNENSERQIKIVQNCFEYLFCLDIPKIKHRNKPNVENKVSLAFKYLNGEIVKNRTLKEIKIESNIRNWFIEQYKFKNYEWLHRPRKTRGIPHSKEWKEKIRNSKKILRGWKLSEETKDKMRFSSRNYIKRFGASHPKIGRNENEILNQIQEIIGFSIKRQFFINGYWLDGYCQELNLAIEIDEYQHFSNKPKIEKDKKREENIIRALHCNFLRINEEDYLNNGLKNISPKIKNYRSNHLFSLEG